MNELQVFTYGEIPVRTVFQYGELWWVLADVCQVLELTNPSVVASRLDEDERAKSNLGRQGEGTIISESGLYKVILRSDKPEAKKFTRWVTHEVLPTLRREGVYSLSATVPAASGKSSEEIQMERERIALEKEQLRQRTAGVMMGLFDRAGIKPEYQIMALAEPLGIKVPALALQGVKVTYDKTTIADKLGILSTAGRPHAQAVGAIISTLELGEDEVEQVPYYRNGHDGFDVQYDESVLEKVRKWIEQNEYPSIIRIEKKYYKVKYR